MNRPDWNVYFMQIAKDISARATCPRAYVEMIEDELKVTVL